MLHNTNESLNDEDAPAMNSTYILLLWISAFTRFILDGQKDSLTNLPSLEARMGDLPLIDPLQQYQELMPKFAKFANIAMTGRRRLATVMIISYEEIVENQCHLQS